MYGIVGEHLHSDTNAGDCRPLRDEAGMGLGCARARARAREGRVRVHDRLFAARARGAPLVPDYNRKPWGGGLSQFLSS